MPIRDFKSALENALVKPSKPTTIESEKAPDHAAVTISFYPTDEQQLGFLMIRRALSPQDPWSGQMAFPGGKQETQDGDLRATALRETHEEIGLNLEDHGSYLGQLSPLQGRRAGAKIPLIITPFVFWLNSLPDFNIDREEVHSTQWIDVQHCLRQSSHTDYTFKRDNFSIKLPALANDPVPVWGISYLMLKELFDRTLRETDAKSLVTRLKGDFWESWRGY